MLKTKHDYRLVAETGWAEALPGGFDHHYVLGYYDDSIQDEATLQVMHSKLSRLFPEWNVVPKDTGRGVKLLLALAGNDDILDAAQEIQRAIEGGAYADFEDVYFEMMGEAMEREWDDMHLDDRIRLCLLARISVANALLTELPPDLSPYLEDVVK